MQRATQVEDDAMMEEEAIENVCFVCGSTEFYVSSSGATCCSNCFTQSQVQTVQEELEFEDINQLMGRNTRFSSGGYRHLGYSRSTTGVKTTRRYVCLQDMDMSKPLPSVERCLAAFQTVLKSAATKICTLIDLTTSSSTMLNCVKHIWLSYLSTWAEAADIYGSKHPHLRFSMRDAFLTPYEVHRLLVHLRYKAKKRLEEVHDVTPSSKHRSRTTCDTTPKGKRRKVSVKNEVDTATIKSTVDGEDFNEKQRKNRFAGYETLTVKEAKKYFPEYFFENEFKVPSSPGNQHEIIQMLEKEAINNPHSITKHEAALRLDAPSMRFILAILHCALTHLRAGVSASHLLHFALNGSIPYLNAFAQALSQEQQDDLSGLKQFFTATFVPQPAYIEHDSILLTIVSGFAQVPVLRPVVSMKETLCETTSGITVETLDPSISRINAPLLACRIIQRVGLPRKVLLNAFSMMGIFPQKHTEDGFFSQELSIASCQDQWLPPPLSSAAPECLLTTADVIAVIVVACKFCRGWEFWTYKNSHCTIINDDDKNNYVNKQMNSYLERQHRNEVWTQGSRVIPWNDCQLRLLTNLSAVSYLDFFDDTIFESYPYRKDFVGFMEWLEKQKNRYEASSVVEEDDNDIFSLYSRTEGVAANDILLSGAVSGPYNSGFLQQDGSGADQGEQRNQWREGNGIGRYIFYPKIVRGGKGQLAFHSHYGALLEFFAQKELVDAVDIHAKVTTVEKDLLKHFNDMGLREPAAQKNTGPWALSEHEELLAAMKLYGREWKKIAAKVKTRSLMQIRNYVAGLQKATGKWTAEEHQAFLEGLKLYGKRWNKVASTVRTRTEHQTRMHAESYFERLQKAINERKIDFAELSMIDLRNFAVIAKTFGINITTDLMDITNSINNDGLQS